MNLDEIVCCLISVNNTQVTKQVISGEPCNATHKENRGDQMPTLTVYLLEAKLFTIILLKWE